MEPCWLLEIKSFTLSLLQITQPFSPELLGPKATSPFQGETGFCSRPWIPYNGHCFYLNRTEKTWPEAQRDCRFRGGDLVSIHSVEDQSFVISQLGFAVWIGLSAPDPGTGYLWSDGSPLQFQDWDDNEPDNKNNVESCVQLLNSYRRGTWGDVHCEKELGCLVFSHETP
uniref:Mannose receptor, C type 1b n=1 Tax=Labrus bergylta TaxID=56723 RepID=A0A3Q3MH18_9LABR